MALCPEGEASSWLLSTLKSPRTNLKSINVINARSHSFTLRIEVGSEFSCCIRRQITIRRRMRCMLSDTDGHRWTPLISAKRFFSPPSRIFYASLSLYVPSGLRGKSRKRESLLSASRQRAKNKGRGTGERRWHCRCLTIAKVTSLPGEGVMRGMPCGDVFRVTLVRASHQSPESLCDEDNRVCIEPAETRKNDCQPQDENIFHLRWN